MRYSLGWQGFIEMPPKMISYLRKSTRMHSNAYFPILNDRVRLFRHGCCVVLDHKNSLNYSRLQSCNDLRDLGYHLSWYTSEVVLPRQAGCLQILKGLICFRFLEAINTLGLELSMVLDSESAHHSKQIVH